MLLQNQIDEVTRFQVARQQEFMATPPGGKIMEFLGKKFLVLPNVFIPFEDSRPLLENYTVQPGEVALDVCTGSGVIAIFSAYKGARKVVALDINPVAVKNTQVNAHLHNFDSVIEARLSDVLDALSPDEQFDVVTMNPPFRNLPAKDYVEATQWDTDLMVHKKFFVSIGRHLKPQGRIYLSQASFGARTEMYALAEAAGFQVKLIGLRSLPDPAPIVFYAFELRRK